MVRARPACRRSPPKSFAIGKDFVGLCLVLLAYGRPVILRSALEGAGRQPEPSPLSLLGAPRSGLGHARGSSIERWFSATGKPGRFDLARSGAPALSVADLLGLATAEDVDEYLGMSLDYGAGAGSDRLRAAIASACGADSSDVVVTHGAVEALLLACSASLGDRRDVLTATPAYEGLLRAVEAAGGNAHRSPVWHPGCTRLDIGPIGDLDLSRYAAVVVNSPHNPTGLKVDASELEAVSERCAASGTTLIVDEVSLGTLDPSAVSAARQVDPGHDCLMVVGDVSKAFGLGGLRIGWCITRSPELRRRVVELRDLTTLANSTPGQLLAALALENRSRLSVCDLARANLDHLDRWMSSMPSTRWVAPEDGLVAFCGLPLLPQSSLRFAERLRATREVSVVPGAFFGHEGHLRIGLGVDESAFVEGLHRLSAELGGDRP